jgi:hypothetical protein
MPVEIILLPLAHDGPHHTRILGCFAPLEQPYWIGTHPVVRQPIHSLRLIWPEERPATIRRGDQVNDPVLPPAEPRPASIAARRLPARHPVVAHDQTTGRRVGHLRVLDGGRDDNA